MLVVTEEEALPAEALVAAHHVDTGLLAAAVALRALVQVCRGKGARGEHSSVAQAGHGHWVAQVCWAAPASPQLEERGILDRMEDEGKAQQEWLQGSHSFPD